MCFIIEFESGVIVITHWKQNNYLQNDRVKPTLYKSERALLVQDKNGVYMLKTSVEATCIQNVYNLDTNCIHRIDKNRIEEKSKSNRNYCEEEDTSCARESNEGDDYDFLEFSTVMDTSGLESSVEPVMWIFLRLAKDSGIIYDKSMLREKIERLNAEYGRDESKKKLRLVRDYCAKNFKPDG